MILGTAVQVFVHIVVNLIAIVQGIVMLGIIAKGCLAVWRFALRDVWVSA